MRTIDNPINFDRFAKNYNNLILRVNISHMKHISMFLYHNEFNILYITILNYHIITTCKICLACAHGKRKLCVHAYKKNDKQVKKKICMLKCCKINVLITLKTVVPV